MVRVLLPTLLLAACLGIGYLVWQQTRADPEPSTPPGTGASSTETAESATITTPLRSPPRGSRPAPPTSGAGLRLPDGSVVAPLNGVRTPAPLVWGDRPFSPIVGVERSRDVEWYVHADGTRTTTIEVWRDDLGRKDPATLVARPGEPLPVDF